MMKEFENNNQILEIKGDNVSLVVSYRIDQLAVLIFDDREKVGVILEEYEVRRLSDFLLQYLSSKKEGRAYRE